LAYDMGSGCWKYDGNKEHIAKYGYLYNNKVVRKACPDGWHLPSWEEWSELRKNVPDGNLKASFGWHDNSNGTDESGFSALPGGCYEEFDSGWKNIFIGTMGCWWATEDVKYLRRISISYRSGYSTSKYFNTRLYSIRCVKD